MYKANMNGEILKKVPQWVSETHNGFFSDLTHQ